MPTPVRPDPFDTMIGALQTAFTANGLTLYDHLPPVLYGAPSVYLDVTGVSAGEFDSDQGVIQVGRIEATIRVFVPLTQDPQIAECQAFALTNVIYAALGEATLTERVKSSDVDAVRFDRANLSPDSKPMRLVEADVWLEAW